MSNRERDSVESWTLPERSRPPLLGDLVERIDEALATARASEAAVMTVGAAALDAADQAKRAADLAERASRGLMASAPVGAGGLDREHGVPGGTPQGGMDSFTARADRVAERLRRLQRLPLSA
jgi:2-methylcitrate dehydratase PrpD